MNDYSFIMRMLYKDSYWLQSISLCNSCNLWNRWDLSTDFYMNIW